MKECDILEGQNITLTLLHIFRGHSPQPQDLAPAFADGRICLQVKLFYDASLHQLVVTIVSAVELPARDNGQPRNPYCKLYLLPDRR